ncbi:hypothetical protein DFJ43DRAFT_1160388 [Lentinula guzmanii]|uniref:WKF domain-containing protein n=1 Tax=Lentinula guzmanii TaxID=2804957 RepID=A0AA38JAV6_9AGAR|nr:hypothetical protein DFJ43DRAFT_1160388 [Lentinula guzmanii]
MSAVTPDKERRNKKDKKLDDLNLRPVDSEKIATGNNEMDVQKKRKKVKRAEKVQDKGSDKEEGSRSAALEQPDVDTVEQEDEVSSEKKKEKKRRKISELDAEGAPTKRKKKRKREDSENADTGDTLQAEKPKKKKSRNKTGFLDPAEEPSLSAQAQKALSYAFQQFRKPSKWKFQKARQNWIIRNWVTENIPDSQIPLVLKYLSNVQGNIRENLTKTCELIISTENSNPASPSVVTERNDDQDEDEMTQLTKQAIYPMKLIRAKAMLAALKDKTEV